MYQKVFLFLLTLAFGLSAQDRQRNDLACVVKLPIPPYPILARSARRTGTVQASVLIGRKSSASVVTKPTTGLLAEAVRRALTEEAVYDSICGSTTVELTFTFELVGPESDTNRDTVFFYPPNRFLIRNRLPMVEPQGSLKGTQ